MPLNSSILTDLTNNPDQGVNEPASTTANLTKLEHLLHTNDLTRAELDLAINTDIMPPGKNESPAISASSV